MTVMITNITSLEERTAKVSKLLETLVDSVKEKGIICLFDNKVDGLTEKEPIAIKEPQTQSQQESMKSFINGVVKSLQVVTGGLILLNQLKDNIKDQVKSITQPFYMYTKPYTQGLTL